MKSSLFSIGFRPFFLFGSVLAVALITLWQFSLLGHLELKSGWNPIIWHGHEMVFGFASAVIAGFILTASGNWAGKPGVSGQKLMALFALWFLARALSTSSGALSIVYSIADVLFYPCLILLLIPYLGNSSQKRNWNFFTYFGILAFSNILIHLQQRGMISFDPRLLLKLSINMFFIIIILISGRIVPFFTTKVITNADIKVQPAVEKASLFSLYLIAILEIIFPNASVLLSVVYLFAALIHIKRFMGWSFIKALKVPILAILYISYLWLIVYLLLNALQPYLNLASSAILHVGTVGVIGLIIYGMITRVSLGHTGRKIVANPATLISYLLMNFAVISRGVLVMLLPGQYAQLLLISSVCWSLAFILYLVGYTRILIVPREN